MNLKDILKNNVKDMDSEFKKFIPQKINKSWVDKILGSNNQDIDALNEALAKPIWDFMNRGGKRIRPLIMLLCCEAVGGNSKKIKNFGLVPELIHNGTLIADDIEDSSLTRRNQPTIHIKYGMDVAVNASGFLYYMPLLLVKNSKIPEITKLKIYSMINNELLKLHFGQATDIHWHRTIGRKITEKQYFTTAANKSGTLARLSAKLGTILGGGTEKQIEGLGKFAEALGVAFQIQDDILNLQGAVGKEFGEDISEGKMSFPVIRTLSVANKNDKNSLIRILRKHTKDKSEIKNAIEIINRYESLQHCRKVADKIVYNSLHLLERLVPASKGKNKLIALARYMAEREN
jgi:geranylgeranyl diphosphate synthase, type I